MELFKYVVGEKGYDDFEVFTKNLPERVIDPTKESFRLYGSKLYKSWKELGNAPIIGGFVDLGYSSIETLDGLESVEGYFLSVFNTPIKSLGNLKIVGRDLNLYDTPNLESLGKLKSVGRNLFLTDTPKLKSLGKLDHVGGRIFVNKGSSTEELVKNSKFADKVQVRW